MKKVLRWLFFAAFALAVVWVLLKVLALASKIVFLVVGLVLGVVGYHFYSVYKKRKKS